MRILLTGYPTMGGSGLITTRLGIELANKGHDVHFLFYSRPFFLKDNDKEDNLTFHKIEQIDYALFRDIGSPYTIQAASKLAEVVRTHNIDIIHSHYAIPHAVSSYLASKMTSVKTIVTTHGSDAHTLGREASFNSTIGLALRESTLVTSVSNYLSRETEEVFKLPPHSVSTVYDFVNTDTFKPQGNRQRSLIQASNFRTIKQIPLLVEIFAEVATEFPDWSLKLVGDGPDLTRSLREARKHNIRDQVKFLGVRKDIPKLFAEAEIIVSSSSMESFGLTLAEGMSCETPVWAPKVGGIPEVCTDGKTGYLYDLNDREEAANKLAAMMENQSLRIRMGKASRKRIIENFSIEPVVSKYETIYEEIIQEN